MKLYLTFLLFLAVHTSCNTKKDPRILAAKNLKSYFITVNNDSAYSLKTPKGALIKIPANSFNVSPGSGVQIEIKEAYSIQDILLGGLSTQTDGKPLRSAGMLYLNATVNNKAAEFSRSIEVTIPGKTFDESMQLYRGNIREDSSINWIEPEQLDTSRYAKNIYRGELLFKSMCANCHKANSEFTGPKLAGSRQRAPYTEWAYNFVNNSVKMVQTDSYANFLYRKYGSVMTPFPALTRSEIKFILDYCDNEAAIRNDKSLNINTPEPTEGNCGNDTFYYPLPSDNIVIVTNEDSIADEVQFISNPIDSSSLNMSEESILPEVGMYQFTIDESGWYNIDVLIDEPTATNVQLSVKVQMDQETEIRIYLCIPRRKILLAAENYADGIYTFTNSGDKSIRLMLNDDAIIFANTSVKEKVYYAISKFKVSAEQAISLNMKESSSEEILEAFRDDNLDGIQLGIRKAEMEVIPKPCDPIKQSTTVSK